MNWCLFSSKEGCTVFDLITKGLPRLVQASLVKERLALITL